MNAGAVALRAGVHRGWIEFRQNMTNAQDIWSVVFFPVIALIVMYMLRGDKVPGTDFSLGSHRRVLAAPGDDRRARRVGGHRAPAGARRVAPDGAARVRFQRGRPAEEGHAAADVGPWSTVAHLADEQIPQAKAGVALQTMTDYVNTPAETEIDRPPAS
ncbi:hypothetical protein [Microtetraspora glauca]|uniref:hypothetical protein n=1 Tax=Microtetraspora glauca TaxID=1996 RepID=UPI003F4CF392